MGRGVSEHFDKNLSTFVGGSFVNIEGAKLCGVNMACKCILSGILSELKYFFISPRRLIDLDATYSYVI